jgi:tetratricopeptide (TPR) repeat protein
MGIRSLRLKSIVAAGLVTVVFSIPAAAERLDELFTRLQDPKVDSEAVEGRIWAEWSKSGSPAMDLLLDRGRKAMAAQDWQTAIGFFTALVDHAPDFAEGWNERATAYFNAGLYGPSVDDLRHALSLEPRHFGAMSGLAMILEDTGHPKDALEVWKKVAELTPYRKSVQQTLERLERQVGGQTL